jgi:hypothetical protein
VTEGSPTDQFWTEVGVRPVKVALPNAVGVTLRAYRPVSEIVPTEPDTGGDDDLFAAPTAPSDEELFPFEADDDEPDPSEFRDEPPPDEEAPLFLSHRGRLQLFGDARSLVEFVQSDAPHDMRQLDTWSSLAKRVRPDDVEPREEDTYELDLVVENLRGGVDAWDFALLISAGEFARDIGQALHLTSVINTMSPGSPLDDLDEALRAATGGGIGGALGRRRLRRFGAQQASLGWRNVIGKVSGATDWRE